MDFNEKTKIVGRLEIIKVDSRTGKEEVLFDEKNVITEGLGRSIAQMMTVPNCSVEVCKTASFLENGTYQEGIDYLIGE